MSPLWPCPLGEHVEGHWHSAVAKATECLELEGLFFGRVEGKSAEKGKQWLEKFWEKAKTP